MIPRLPYLKETVSQTVGPFVHIGLMPHVAGLANAPAGFGLDIAGPEAPGERITITGRVIDGMGAPLRDMMIEIWQADAAGIHASPEDPRHEDVTPGFRGFGRVETGIDHGVFRIETIKPGAVPGRHTRPQAPHLNLWLVARGINIGLSTRLYFADEAEANAADPVLTMIDPAHRAETLLARPDGAGRYSFDIHLQGDKETVFFDV